MFTLFHFGFQFFKMALQTLAYTATITLLKHLFISRRDNKLHRLTSFKLVYSYIFGLLFVYSFSYYGNHGLGDESMLPLGNAKKINCGDGYAYLYINSSHQMDIDSFLVRKDNLCFASHQKYYVYRIKHDKLSEFSNMSDYENYAAVNKLPKLIEFKDFYANYDAYWNDWRFWLLP